jgi:hypothetical protein
MEGIKQQNRVIEEYIDNLMQIGTTTITDFTGTATDSDATAATESDVATSGGQKGGDSSGSEEVVKKNKRKQRKPVKIVGKVIKKPKSSDKKIPTESTAILPKSVVGKKRHCTPMLIVPLCMVCDACKASFSSMH